MVQQIQNIRIWQKILRVLKIQQGNPEPLVFNSNVIPVIDITKTHADCGFYFNPTGTSSSTVGARPGQSFFICAINYSYDGSTSSGGDFRYSIPIDDGNNIAAIHYCTTGQSFSNFVGFPIPIKVKEGQGILCTSTDITDQVYIGFWGYYA